METKPVESTEVEGKTWRPTTAGILIIVAGAIGLIIGIVIAALGEIIGPMIGFGFGAAGGAVIAFGIIAIVGGIYTLKRRIWGLALAGSIFALVCVWFLGIPAIIFVAQARKEFA